MVCKTAPSTQNKMLRIIHFVEGQNVRLTEILYQYITSNQNGDYTGSKKCLTVNVRNKRARCYLCHMKIHI